MHRCEPSVRPLCVPLIIRNNRCDKSGSGPNRTGSTAGSVSHFPARVTETADAFSSRTVGSHNKNVGFFFFLVKKVPTEIRHPCVHIALPTTVWVPHSNTPKYGYMCV